MVAASRQQRIANIAPIGFYWQFSAVCFYEIEIQSISHTNARHPFSSAAAPAHARTGIASIAAGQKRRAAKVE